MGLCSVHGDPEECECGGLIHAEVGGENKEHCAFWKLTKCDKCGKTGSMNDMDDEKFLKYLKEHGLTGERETMIEKVIRWKFNDVIFSSEEKAEEAFSRDEAHKKFKKAAFEVYGEELSEIATIFNLFYQDLDRLKQVIEKYEWYRNQM